MSRELRQLHGLILGIAVVVAAVPAFATTVQRMELPALVSASDAIVQGRVESVEARWENNLAYTYTSVTVDDPLKGDRRRAVLIRQLGGKIGNLNVTVSGMPQFKQGDQVIVFLKGRRDGTFDVVGLNQGKYEIVNDTAIANVSGLTLVNEKTGRLEEAGFVDKAPLEAFKTKIRGLVK